MVQRHFRAGQIVHVLGLDGGQQVDAFVIVRELGKLLADFHNRLERPAQFPFGERDGIIRFRLQRFCAAVIQIRQGTDEEVADLRRPQDTQDNAASTDRTSRNHCHGIPCRFSAAATHAEHFANKNKFADDEHGTKDSLEKNLGRVFASLQRPHCKPDEKGKANGRKNDIRHILQDLTHG